MIKRQVEIVLVEKVPKISCSEYFVYFRVDVWCATGLAQDESPPLFPHAARVKGKLFTSIK
jgi:hypothetical protein